MKYRTIVADPPWPVRPVGRFKGRHSRPECLPYPTMSLLQIQALPVGELSAPDAHLWLWTTNGFLREAFDVMQAWGFHYLTTITWVKPSGFGPYFLSRTQHCLFGYREQCQFPLARFQPNVLFGAPRRHSEKPEAFRSFIETISPAPRLELFARSQPEGWHTWGNECVKHVDLTAA